MLANHNIHVVVDLRTALCLYFSLADSRLCWAFYLPYLFLLRVLGWVDLRQILGRLKIINFVVIDCLHFNWIGLRRGKQVDLLIVGLNLAIDHIDSLDVLISNVAQTIGLEAVVKQEDEVLERVAAGQDHAIIQKLLIRVELSQE